MRATRPRPAHTQALTGTDRLSVPRPEREERRLAFFKDRKKDEAAAPA
jgi:hypothetical protein